MQQRTKLYERIKNHAYHQIPSITIPITCPLFSSGTCHHANSPPPFPAMSPLRASAWPLPKRRAEQRGGPCPNMAGGPCPNMACPLAGWLAAVW